MKRNEGIEQSYAAQNHRCLDWGRQAQTHMHRWLCTKAATENWSIEDFREYAESRGLPEPENGSAYGRVVSTAARRGLIKFQGYYPASRASAHSRPLRVWRAA